MQVGLDFGTSATKATFRVLGRAGSKITPISFAHGLGVYPDFCLPSLAAFSADGALHLGADAAKILRDRRWEEGLRSFKMLVAASRDRRYLDSTSLSRFETYVAAHLGSETRCRPDTLAATYLAYAIRDIRKRIYKLVGTADVDLIVNTCVPIDQRENSGVMKAFERVIATAQKLDETRSPGEDPSMEWLDFATAEMPGARYQVDDPATRMFVVPEAVASVAAYLTSLKRQWGLHALVDIGAGTTDLSIFFLTPHLGTSGTSWWYASRSVPVGMDKVETDLAEQLATTGARMHSRQRIQSAISSGGRSSGETKQITAGFHDIWLKTSKGWSDAFQHLRAESEWRGDKLKIFLAGGGGQTPLARTIFRQSPFNPRWGPHPCNLLPNPDGYDDRKGSIPFARLSVAHGLAIPYPELTAFVLPLDAPDHTPLPPDNNGRFEPAGEDELIPKYGWT